MLLELVPFLDADVDGDDADDDDDDADDDDDETSWHTNYHDAAGTFS